jgi:CSLREA domain-containing protein
MKKTVRHLKSFMRRCFGPSPSGTAKARRQKHLHLEALEDRCVPAVIVVTTAQDEVGGDDGKISLREAIMAANTNAAVFEAPAGSAGLDTIRFAPDLAGKMINLNSELGPLTVTESLTLVGLGAKQLTISGNTNSRIFDLAPADASQKYKVTLTGVTLTNGFTDSDGGAAIHTASFTSTDSLTIRDCVLSHNQTANNSANDNDGGALRMDAGNLTIQNSTFSDNIAGGEGGAIRAHVDNLTIQDSTFSANTSNGQAGAMVLGTSKAGRFAIERATFEQNQAGSGGGGALWIDDGVGTISQCTFSKNTAGGEGGAIHIDEGPNVTIQNTTISANTSYGAEKGGGGISNLGDLMLRNVTITGNRAKNSRGGGILNSVGDTPGITTIVNTIVEGNFDLTGQNDLARGGGKINAQFSLIQSPARAINGTDSHNIFGFAASLGPLQDNGGPTKTHELLPGSKALNAGSNALVDGLTTDQRGLPRIVDVVDMGAFEVQSARRGRRWQR